MSSELIERRRCTPGEARVATRGKTLYGYAAVFNSPSVDLGGFVERIVPGAFGRSLRAVGSDVRAFVDHDPGRLLGRQGSGTLRIQEDDRGLHFELDVPETQDGRDVLELVGRRDLDGMSFAFRVPDPDRDQSWRAGFKGAPDERTLLNVEVQEISLVTFPAYPDTTLALRSRAAQRTERDAAHFRMRLRLARARTFA